MADTRPKGVSVDDAVIGARIRLRRKQLRITQSELAEVLGLTFQQVQKYERGVNRIAAGRLNIVASKPQTSICLAEPGALELVTKYGRLKPAARRPVLTVVRALAGERTASGDQ